MALNFVWEAQSYTQETRGEVMATPLQASTESLARSRGQGDVQMRRLGIIIRAAAVLVFLICLYSFLVGNGVFSRRFDNDGIAWYFLAKGIFCSLALYLLFKVLEALPRAN